MGRLLDEILHHTYPYLTEEQVESVLKDYPGAGVRLYCRGGRPSLRRPGGYTEDAFGTVPLLSSATARPAISRPFSRRTACSAI